MTLRCLHVVECFAGGTLEVVRTLANDQSQKGWHVQLLHGQRPDSPVTSQANELFDPAVQRHVMPFSAGISPHADFLSLCFLMRWLRAHPQDVIHLHSSKAGLIGRLAARLLGLQLKVLYTPHSWSFQRQDISRRQALTYRILEWLGVRLGGKIVACSREEARLAREHLKATNVELVRNGMRLPAPLQVSEGIPDLTTVICVGRIAPQKAPDRFARLASSLADKAVRFLWVGDGDPFLREQLSAAGVMVTGQLERSRVAALLGQSQLFVLLSAWEGLPLALVEAQAMGLPAVVSDIPGCLEVVQHGINGLVASTDAEAAIHVRALLDNPEERTRFSIAAREMSETKFSVERFLQESETIYRSVVAAC